MDPPAEARRRRPRALGPDRVALLVAAGACLLVAGYLFAQQRQESRLRTANLLGAHGRFAAAVTEARQVTRPPARARAALVEAYALRAMGRLPQAALAFRRAANEDPANWTIRRDFATTLLAVGRGSAARAQLRRALRLNPRMGLPPGFAAPPG